MDGNEPRRSAFSADDRVFPFSQPSADFVRKDVVIESMVYKVHIWDTAGQEVYHSITGPYFRNAAGVLLFFDLTDRSSFEALDYWFNLIAENTRAMPPLVVLGNKCDLRNRRTSSEEAREYCQRRNVTYFDVSAKNGTNAELALNTLVADIVEKDAPTVQMPVRLNLPPTAAQKEENACC
jgi:small GTP-binding protein